jgi:hypothetical protein
MKKKYLSPEALAALATGKKLDLAADAGPGVEGSAEGSVETVVEGAAENDSQEETTFSAEDLAAHQEQIDGLTTDVAELTEKTEALAKENDELKAAAISADAKVKAAAEEVSEFKGIVIGHISAMRIGLSLAAVDMSNWTAEAILREYASVSESFEKALPMGAQVPETVTTPAEVKVIKTSHDAAAVKALGF